jgi:predicted neuraminidase
MFFSFKQQSNQWQQRFASRQSAGPLQRVLAWLILGLILLAGAAILVFMLLLSWILIPILLFRQRAKIKAWQQRQQAGADKTAEQQGHSVIEGEVLQKREE